MGATLGHMVVMYFNTTRKEVIGMTSSIDSAKTTSHEKANVNANVKFAFESTGWEKTDQIVCVLSVLMIEDPHGGVVKTDSDYIVFDTNYNVSFDVITNDLDDGCHIEKFYIFDKTTLQTEQFKTTEFKNVYSDDSDSDDHSETSDFNCYDESNDCNNKPNDCDESNSCDDKSNDFDDKSNDFDDKSNEYGNCDESNDCNNKSDNCDEPNKPIITEMVNTTTSVDTNSCGNCSCV
jgi:hypothetical protein